MQSRARSAQYPTQSDMKYAQSMRKLRRLRERHRYHATRHKRELRHFHKLPDYILQTPFSSLFKLRRTLVLHDVATTLAMQFCLDSVAATSLAFDRLEPTAVACIAETPSLRAAAARWLVAFRSDKWPGQRQKRPPNGDRVILIATSAAVPRSSEVHCFSLLLMNAVYEKRSPTSRIRQRASGPSTRRSGVAQYSAGKLHSLHQRSSSVYRV